MKTNQAKSFAKAMTKLDVYIENQDIVRVFSVSSKNGHRLRILTKQGDGIPLMDCTSQKEVEELREVFNGYIENVGANHENKE